MMVDWVGGKGEEWKMSRGWVGHVGGAKLELNKFGLSWNPWNSWYLPSIWVRHKYFWTLFCFFPTWILPRHCI